MELTIDQALQQGIAAHEEGKLQDAERLYRAVLQSQPSHPDANHNLGVLAVSVGKVQEALTHLKLALETNPKQGQFWLSYIDALIKLGQVDNARQLLQQGKASGLKGEKVDQLEVQLSSIANSNSPVIANTSNPSKKQIDELVILYKQGKLQEAIVQANTLARQFPNNAIVQNVLGASYSGLGNFKDAINRYKKAIKLKSDHAEAHNNLGAVLNKLGQYEEAITSYKKGIKLKPNFVETYYNLGNILINIGRNQEAVTIYNKAIELMPFAAEVHNNLGNALKNIDKKEETIASYTKAIELKPDFAEAYNNLGAALSDIDKYEKAVISLVKVVKLNPYITEAWYNLGNSLKSLDKKEEAITSYSKAIGLKPEYAEAYNNLGIILNELGKQEEAIINYNRAIDLKLDYAEAYSNRGISLSELGKYEDAQTSFYRAIELSPFCAKTYFSLGVMLGEYEKYGGSQKNYKKSLLLSPANSETYIELGKNYQLAREFFMAKSLYAFSIILHPVTSFANVYIHSVNRQLSQSNSLELKKSNPSQSSYNRGEKVFKSELKVDKSLPQTLYSLPNFTPSQENEATLHKNSAAIREGGVWHSQGFNLFGDDNPIIKKLEKNLTIELSKQVDGSIFIAESFFAIYKGASIVNPHNHLTVWDVKLGLHQQKYAAVYYVQTGDQNTQQPGVLNLYDPDMAIVPKVGDLIIFPANITHSVSYDGNDNRIIIGVNFYRI